ncbi:ComEC/Rec2 family competence protein [Pedobacter sp. MR22-3]|uniref:ComEC/Rec2 family competence protein n=1 Tax=Pedobacter sp. MR22-3 TaxID=2994552 RepID=UPI002AFF8278|nr:ComEC/Rec2 family competence protein [Pedobacter sp. MR22-3]
MLKEEYFFVRILAALIPGIVFFYLVSGDHMISVLGTVCFLLYLTICMLNIFYKKLNAYRFKGYTGLLIYLLFFFLGGLLTFMNKEELKPDYFTKKTVDYLKVMVNSEPAFSKGILRLKVKIISGYLENKPVKLSGQILLAIKTDRFKPLKLRYGDELFILAKYSAVEPPYNPGEFNFKQWLAIQNIYEQAFINQNQFIKTGRNTGNPMLRFAINWREQQVIKYRKYIKNDEAFAVASTLILGYRADLSAETLSAYAKTGTIHALSVSGSHVAIIFFALDFLLVFLDKQKALKIFKFMLICTLIWTYALITGLSPSVVRAAIMITIFIIAKTFAQNKNSYNILAFAAFCQLIYQPFLIWDPGFQLSYLSVFGLLYLQPKIYTWIYLENKWLNKIWELTALSIAAQLATFPLCVYYFHQFPVYFLLGNLFISLPLMIIMVLGIVILLPFSGKLTPLFEWIIVTTNQVLKWIAGLPYATFSSWWITLPGLILLSLSLAFFVYAMAKYNKTFLFAAMLTFIIYQSVLSYDRYKAARQQKIIFFTLRKNYAAAFIQGYQAILLTDLNHDDQTFHFSVKPALDQLQVSHISIMHLKTDTIIPNFIFQNQQIIFHGYKILIIDESWNNKKVQAAGKFNAIWLTGNTTFKIENLPEEIQYENIILDATNKDYKIERFKKNEYNYKARLQILKKNPAYLVQSTE